MNQNFRIMNKLIILVLFAMTLMAVSCSDEVNPAQTYKGFFVESEGGLISDFFQEPDTLILVLNASNVPCEYAETIEEVPCGDSPTYLRNTYILTISDNSAVLTIGTGAQKFGYYADKTVRSWNYYPGEYILNKTGYEEYHRLLEVYKAIVMKDNINFTTKIAFVRKVGDKDEIAFVKYGPFTYTEYGPKRSQEIEIPASIKEYHLSVSKEDEYNLKLTGEEIEYKFHIQERCLIQTKPYYKNIGQLSPTN